MTVWPGIKYLGADTACKRGESRVPITEVHSLMLDYAALSQGAVLDSDT